MKSAKHLAIDLEMRSEDLIALAKSLGIKRVAQQWWFDYFQQERIENTIKLRKQESVLQVEQSGVYLIVNSKINYPHTALPV